MESLQSLFQTMLAADLKTALLIGIVAAVLAAGRGLPAPSRHWVWLSAILVGAFLPLLAHLLPPLALPLLAPAQMPALARPHAIGEVLADPAGVALAPLAVLMLLVYLGGCVYALAAIQDALATLARQERLATVVRDGPLFCALARLRARAGMRRPVTLLLSDKVRSPLTYGCLRPRIVLPLAVRDWPQVDIDRALCHELAHISRLDWPVILVCRVACALHWYNPALWFAWRRLVLEAEKSCDDTVLGQGGRPSDYAGQLVNLARPRPSLTVAAIGLGESELSSRIAAILDPNQRRSIPMAMHKPLIAAAVLLLAATLAACQVTRAGETQGALAGTATVVAPTPSGERPAAVPRVPDVERAPRVAPDASPVPDPVVAPAPLAAAVPVAPVAPEGARDLELERAEMEAYQREISRERARVHNEIEAQRKELHRMELELDKQRQAFERQAQQAREQIEQEREHMEAERRHFERERELLEEESRLRERELQRLTEEDGT